MELPDFLTREPDGLILLRGHRLGVQDVVPLYNEGYSPEMLQEQFPTLSLATIHKLIGFYLENQAQVDKYISEHEEQVGRQRAAAKHGPDAAELARRFVRLRRAEAS